MYIAAAQGQTTPGGQNFDVNRNLLSLLSFATRFKNIYLKSDFMHIFFIVYSPGQGLTTPWGQNFDINRNILSLRSFVTSFKKNLFVV